MLEKKFWKVFVFRKVSGNRNTRQKNSIGANARLRIGCAFKVEVKISTIVPENLI